MPTTHVGPQLADGRSGRHRAPNLRDIAMFLEGRNLPHDAQLSKKDVAGVARLRYSAIKKEML